MLVSDPQPVAVVFVGFWIIARVSEALLGRTNFVIFGISGIFSIFLGIFWDFPVYFMIFQDFSARAVPVAGT